MVLLRWAWLSRNPFAKTSHNSGIKGCNHPKHSICSIFYQDLAKHYHRLQIHQRGEMSVQATIKYQTIALNQNKKDNKQPLVAIDCRQLPSSTYLDCRHWLHLGRPVTWATARRATVNGVGEAAERTWWRPRIQLPESWVSCFRGRPTPFGFPFKPRENQQGVAPQHWGLPFDFPLKPNKG